MHVGMPVHYFTRDMGKNIAPLAAIVTCVWSDNVVNLAIFGKDGNAIINPPTSIPFIEDYEAESSHSDNWCSPVNEEWDGEEPNMAEPVQAPQRLEEKPKEKLQEASPHAPDAPHAVAHGTDRSQAPPGAKQGNPPTPVQSPDGRQVPPNKR